MKRFESALEEFLQRIDALELSTEEHVQLSEALMGIGMAHANAGNVSRDDMIQALSHILHAHWNVS